MNKNPRILFNERVAANDWAGAQKLMRNKKHWFYLTGDSRQLKNVNYGEVLKLFPYSVQSRYAISTQDWIKQNLVSLWAIATPMPPLPATYYFLDEKDFIHFKLKFG